MLLASKVTETLGEDWNLMMSAGVLSLGFAGGGIVAVVGHWTLAVIVAVPWA